MLGHLKKIELQGSYTEDNVTILFLKETLATFSGVKRKETLNFY